MTALTVAERCARIVAEFDEWLAVRVLRDELKYEDLPQLNDAFRDYFADTRTARDSGLAMKIILVDNFDRERPGLSDEVLIAEGVSEHYVEKIVTALDANSLPEDDYAFKAVPNNHKLRKYTA